MIDKKERGKVYEKARDRYGIDNQMWVLVEEIGELLQAVGKTGRARTENPKLRDDNHLAEETADVLICLEQLISNLDLEVLIRYMMDFKIARLKNRMEGLNDHL